MSNDRLMDATPSRRAVAQGAVWSVPVLVGVAAAPALAASACTEYAWHAESPGAGAYEKTDSFLVPADVTSVTYRVDGAGGGGVSVASGGAGSVVQGTLAVAAGETLSIVVGAGGAAALTSGVATGGTGYGDGGSSGSATAYTDYRSGGGGGGGSAILRGTTPLVVAGGGGGSGRVFTKEFGDDALVQGISYPNGYSWKGGQGDNDAFDALITWKPITTGTFTTTINADGGKTAGVAGAGGLGGQGPDSTISTEPTPINSVSYWYKRSGNVGATVDPTTGGNGGAGAGLNLWESGDPGPTLYLAGGGGGGGYGGGGGGALVVTRYGTAQSGAPVDTILGMTSGGGGGGSVAPTGATFSVSTAVNTGGDRVPGLVTITYCTKLGPVS